MSVAISGVSGVISGKCFRAGARYARPRERGLRQSRHSRHSQDTLRMPTPTWQPS
jgi:hypothetical protein